MVNWKISNTEASIISKIVDRAVELLPAISSDPMSLSMDVTACHANGCELQLDELLAADDFNFIHDIAGIRRHIDRKTGKLTNCFSPRFSVRDGDR